MNLEDKAYIAVVVECSREADRDGLFTSQVYEIHIGPDVYEPKADAKPCHSYERKIAIAMALKIAAAEFEMAEEIPDVSPATNAN